MNRSNFANLALWLRRKIDALHLKMNQAKKLITTSGLDEQLLGQEWKVQRADAIRRAPSKFLPGHLAINQVWTGSDCDSFL